MLKIYTILCRQGEMDNYSYILQDTDTGICAVLDPSETEPIVKKLQELNLKPDYILNTHHHFDHTEGNSDIKRLYGSKVVGNISDSHRIPDFDIGVQDGDTFCIGNSCAQIIDVSAHTQGHIVWYFAQDKALFTGDTLFNLCIGGLFEGTPEQMYHALDKIKKLPDDTDFYPGHEYTLGGAQFALRFNPNNPTLTQYLQKASQKLQKGESVCPIKLGIEKLCNPFLQANNLNEFNKIF